MDQQHRHVKLAPHGILEHLVERWAFVSALGE
jgi:hypothetical protein